jgi:hypothetical protein
VICDGSNGTVAGDAATKRKKLEPKVIVPFEQRPGKPPRRIEIERKKRLYASQNIEVALAYLRSRISFFLSNLLTLV